MGRSTLKGVVKAWTIDVLIGWDWPGVLVFQGVNLFQIYYKELGLDINNSAFWMFAFIKL